MLSASIRLAIACISTACFTCALAQDLPDAKSARTESLFTVPSYCEGVVFDNQGRGYVSWGKTITRFTIDGKHEIWAETGAPNGHKILADGTHLVCDASQHAVLHLTDDGRMLEPASKQCDGKPLRGPNDLTLDTRHGGFYFSDPGDSDLERRIGTIHYVDHAGNTILLDQGLAFPNGIVLTPDGKKLYLAESQTNQVHMYEVNGPGQLGPRKLFADLPKHSSGDHLRSQPDGMCLDAAGNLYVAHYGMKQVQVLNPHGELIRQYNGGNETTSNVAFGGPVHTTLFITGGLGREAGEGGVFKIELGVPGLKILPSAK